MARDILQVLAEQLRQSSAIDAGLPALLSATRSPRRPVRELAVGQVQQVLLDLTERGDLTGQLGGEVDGAFLVLDALAGANAAKITALVPTRTASIPDDPRLVTILWRCLTAPGIEAEPACQEIVQRLLRLAMDQECFAELQRQLPFDREFAGVELP